ncbi:site-2 protease family protein [Nocardia sp. SYP-A9097]|uniref:site-2 protease family protein n=1 Tax=Nocardia sp. SYP-A9097 TaxID=2663237 RepID=UPI0035C8C454
MFKASLPLGRIAGVRISAHWSALVTVGLFTWILGVYLSGTGSAVIVWTTAAGGALALIACLVAHELAHSIVARHNGVQVQGIVLWLLGGVSELTDEPRDARADLKIALAGPGTSLLLAAGAALGAGASALISPDGPVTAMLIWLATVNTVLAVFNMLPGAPLDGGRVLRALLWWRGGDRLRAASTAARSGQTLGLALILAGIAEVILVGQFGGLWLVLLGWFLRSAAQSESVLAGLRHNLGDTRVREVMSTEPMAVPVDWSIPSMLGSAAAQTKHRVFPVVDAAGHPGGVLAWSDLAAIPEPARPSTRLGDIARHVPAAAIAAPDDLLADVAARIILRPNLDAVLVVDGRSAHRHAHRHRSGAGLRPLRPRPPDRRVPQGRPMTTAPRLREEPQPLFHDRREAGRVLAELLAHYRGDPDLIVLGLARGGVPVAWEVAAALDAPLDTLIVRKLGAPGNPEFAIGALTDGGRIVLNDDLVRAARRHRTHPNPGRRRAFRRAAQCLVRARCRGVLPRHVR